ncbi:phage holin family protein [Pseudonocardia sp. N23]|uniref:phage holin family protein n=1 Tax=Pseudonocardia sp. N23 TaxID=1987376 RepID=UPI000AD77A06|nr:phage holin family protein [Pseudonocardia sp. N23]GAY10256.1 putative membrane protein [Pseudonocardia sp. N23]
MSNALAMTIRVIVVAVALWVATLILSDIRVGTEVNPNSTTASTIGTLVVVAIIFGVVNAVLKPIIKVVGCPLYVLTLGLISLVVNALLLWLAGWIAGKVGLPFAVDGFWAAFWGAIIVGVVSFLLHVLIPDRLDQR